MTLLCVENGQSRERGTALLIKRAAATAFDAVLRSYRDFVGCAQCLVNSCLNGAEYIMAGNLGLYRHGSLPVLESGFSCPFGAIFHLVEAGDNRISLVDRFAFTYFPAIPSTGRSMRPFQVRRASSNRGSARPISGPKISASGHSQSSRLGCFPGSRSSYPLGLAVDVREADFDVLGPERHQPPAHHVEGALATAPGAR